MQAWTLNMTTHRRHQTTSRWQTLSKRSVALCESKAHACLHACSFGTDKFRKYRRDKARIGRFTCWQYRESTRTSGKTRQRFGSEMCLPDVQPRESIFRVLKSSDTRPFPLSCSRFLYSGFAPLWIRPPLTKLNDTMYPLKFNYNSRAKNSNASSWASWLCFERSKFNNPF